MTFDQYETFLFVQCVSLLLQILAYDFTTQPVIGEVVSFGLINYPIYYSVQVAVKHGKIIGNVGTIESIFKGHQNTLKTSTCFLIIRYNLGSIGRWSWNFCPWSFP